MRNLSILVTGGAGFIGSAIIRYLIEETPHQVINLDKLTYAGNLTSLTEVTSDPRYHFVKMDVCDRAGLADLLPRHRPDVIMHLAAESHVDRSIDGPAEFVQTNVMGTYALLEAAREYWLSLAAEARQRFRFHHVSTDEVYGSLGSSGLFSECSSYDPSSPYSATKASSDHLVRAWFRTFGLPVVITNCSNNYGPYQFPEKLMPLMIINAIEGKALPVYGKGDQVRDWLYVEDHARALYKVITEGRIGETYNIGGHNEKTNLEVVTTICRTLDDLMSQHPTGVERYERLITFVEDRPGHDQRYAIDAGKIRRELGWVPAETFESGIQRTVRWYLDNENWWRGVLDGSYRRERLGLL